VCSGGILGLGETDADRIGLIWELSKYCPFVSPFQEGLMRQTLDSLPEHPESFPVNALVPIPGTPLEKNDVSWVAVVFCSSSWC
jgi:biotin synthase